jgi:hypothetical protein
LNVYAMFVDSTPVPDHRLCGGEYAPWRTTVHAIRTDMALWRRMHLAKWNTVPDELPVAGLDAMLARYRPMLTNPRAWDGMTVHDWDMVPPPVRSVAYRQMVRIGPVSTTSGAGIVCRQGSSAIPLPRSSCLNHGSITVPYTAHDRGIADIGFAQASGFARPCASASVAAISNDCGV